MQYDIISDENNYILIKKINRLIAEGWKPLGGVAVGHGDEHFYQAMIKEEDNPDKEANND